MPALESRLERQFALAVRARGGLAIKIIPIIAGLPDRMVLWPGGSTSLVELKTASGKRRAIQIYRHRQLETLGHPVVTLSGEEEIQAWLDDQSL